MMSNELSNYRKVVCYHSIWDVSSFEQHVKILKDQNILITFDDGCTTVYDNAFPVLRKYNVQAILFIITDLIDTDKPFWWDELKYYLPEEGDKVIWEVKKWKNTDREQYLTRLRRESSKAPLATKQLTSSQLLEMQEYGIVIGNHSHTHPMFDKCSEDEIRRELENSRLFFSKNQLTGFSFFAYPNGNWNVLSESLLREYGVRFTFLFDHQINHKFDSMRISRLSVNDTTPLWKLRLITSGLHSMVLPFRKKLKTIFK
jgi:poly-beta-1,6-N-acetyl-D-glucosamine N-deacetylase